MKFSSNLRAILLAASALALLPHHGSAALAVVDQQNASTHSGSLIATDAGDGIGQSFTPTLATLNAATFSLTIGNDSGTVRLDLFAGSGYTGSLLESSAPITVTDPDGHEVPRTYEFDFATPAVLVPGMVYTFRIFETAGQGNVSSEVTDDVYAGGQYFGTYGNPVSSIDLVFAEGTAAVAGVPEPSTWAAVTLGAGLLGVGILRRRRAA